MRVLFLSGGAYSDPPTRRLFDRMAALGVEVTLAMPGRIVHPHFPVEVQETPWPTPGVRLVRLGTWYSHLNPTHVAMKGIPRMIREFRPDIVHCQMEPWGITCVQVSSYLRTFSSRPLFGVQAAESKPRQGGTLAAVVRKTLSRPVLSLCDFFVAWSEPALRGALELGLDGVPSAVIPAVGIDTDLFSPVEPEEKRLLRLELGVGQPGLFLVGYVGRFDREKGVNSLVDAFDRISSANPDLRLLLLGSGSLDEKLQRAVATRPWMSLHAPRHLQGVARFMRALDVLAVPSVTTPAWEEQFGLVTTEAMSCGVPVVGSTCGAIPEVVSQGGWIFPEGDASALAERLAYLAVAQGEVESRGRIARKRVNDNYSEKAVAGRLVDLWRAVSTAVVT